MVYQRRVMFFSWILFLLSTAYFAVILPWTFPHALFSSIIAGANLANYIYLVAMATVLIGAKVTKFFDSFRAEVKAVLYFLLFSMMGPLLIKWFLEFILSMFFTQTITVWVSGIVATLMFIFGMAVVVKDYKEREVISQPKEDE